MPIWARLGLIPSQLFGGMLLALVSTPLFFAAPTALNAGLRPPSTTGCLNQLCQNPVLKLLTPPQAQLCAALPCSSGSVAGVLFLAAHVARIQVFRAPALKAGGARQQQRLNFVPAKRGDLRPSWPALNISVPSYDPPCGWK